MNTSSECVKGEATGRRAEREREGFCNRFFFAPLSRATMQLSRVQEREGPGLLFLHGSQTWSCAVYLR